MFSEDQKQYEKWKLFIFRKKFALRWEDEWIISQMLQQGVPRSKAVDLIALASEEYLDAKSKGMFKRVFRKKFFIYAFVTCILVVIPLFLLSYHVLKGTNPVLSVVLAAAITFCIIMMIANYRTPPNYDPDNDPYCIEPHRYSYKLLLLWIPMFFGLMSIQNIKHSEAIRNEVVLTTGIILSGQAEQWAGRFTKNNHYSVQVNLPNGSTQTINLSRQSDHHLFEAYIGQEVILAWHEDESSLRKLLMPYDTLMYNGKRTENFRKYVQRIDEHRSMDQFYIRSHPERIDTIDVP